MGVYKDLSVNDSSQPTRIYVVYTGKKYPLTDEQNAKCNEYLDHLNHIRQQNGEQELKNGKIYTIVNVQQNPNGELLVLTEETTYAHFITYRDRKSEVVSRIFQNDPIPPCPVGNPQTMILPKPETQAAKEAGKRIASRFGRALKSDGPRVVLGVMGNDTAFKEAAQAFGAGLNERNMTRIDNPSSFVNSLRERGFQIESKDVAGVWDFQDIIDQSLKDQAGIQKTDQAADSTLLGAFRDNDGNYYFTYLTPVKKTIKEILNGKPNKSKFRELISVPANPIKAMAKLARQQIEYRVYIPKAIEIVQKMVRNR